MMIAQTDPDSLADNSRPGLAASTRQYPVLELDGVEHGIDTGPVREIGACATLSRVTGTPTPVLGTSSLRRTTVPIVDLPMRLGESGADRDRKTAVRVLDVGSRLKGVFADSVSGGVPLSASALRPASEFSERVVDRQLQTIGMPEQRSVIPNEVALRLTILQAVQPPLAIH